VTDAPTVTFEELEGSDVRPVPPEGEEPPPPTFPTDEGEPAPAPMPADLSRAGAEFIAGFEGCVLHLYNDPVHHCTVGIGHLVHHGRCDGRPSEAPFRDGITRERAYDIFREDVVPFARAIRRHVRVPLNQPQFDALLSWAFNCGAGVLRTSTLARRLNAGDYDSVPSELMRWNKAGNPPRVLPGLTRRRRAEGELFAHGRYE
jgi:lysozyme